MKSNIYLQPNEKKSYSVTVTSVLTFSTLHSIQENPEQPILFKLCTFASEELSWSLSIHYFLKKLDLSFAS